MQLKSRVVVIAVAGASFALACGPASETPPVSVGHELQALVSAAVEGHATDLGAALHVDAPALGVSWEGAAGVADPATGEPMTASLPVLVASNTKTFISASILRLWEIGLLDIDDPIVSHLPTEYVELLRGDGYDPESITIRHLLTHTAGLFDFADADIYTEEIMADPGHRWTRTEQLESAMEWGDPYGPPGEVYRYCDTGYILLGEILEQVTGETMPGAVRELVGYERLGLGSTWFETLEPRPEGVPSLAHQFWAGIDVTTIDPSQDLYGGGGLASTVGDLARFFRGVFTGGFYAHLATLDVMLSTVEVKGAGPDYFGSEQKAGPYRMGVKVSEVAGFTVYSHGGFFGTVGAYVPDLDLALGATVNRTESHDALDALVEGSISAVAAARP